MNDMRLDPTSNKPARAPEAVAASLIGQRDPADRPASTHRLVPPRSINRNSAVASGSSFFNGWRSTPGTTPLTSQLALLISTTTTKVEIGSNAVRFRLRSLTWATGQPPSVRVDDEGATTSAARPIASLLYASTCIPVASSASSAFLLIGREILVLREATLTGVSAGRRGRRRGRKEPS